MPTSCTTEQVAIANMGFKGGEGNDNIVVSVSGAVADGGAGNDVIDLARNATPVWWQRRNVLSIFQYPVAKFHGGRGDNASFRIKKRHQFFCYGWATVAISAARDGFQPGKRDKDIVTPMFL